MNRDEHLTRLSAGEIFDLLVIGGGATGLGAALDAAARGHRVALVEQSDFAKGTSSRSTKLVHGGVRYLKQGNVKLVREALRERGLLARNAPHLVRDLAFVIPAYSRFDRLFYGAGLKLYDALAGELSLGRSLVLDRDETLARLPTAEPAGLVGGVLYHDGQFDDARLAVDLARAAAAHGATLVNHCRCAALLKDASGRVAGARVVDAETGRETEIRARAVVNATGVFVDELRRLDEPAARDLVAVSQGVHLVLPRKFLPGDAALMVPKTADGRVLFALPWHDRVVVGTTDTPRPRAELEPRALRAERDFILEHARKYLALDPSESDVLSVFAGLRPLVNSRAGANTARLSREHAILVAPSGLLTITGGKWTTYRRMARDVVDQAEQAAGLARRECVTARLPIAAPDAAGLDALLAARPELGAKIHPALPCRRGDIVWQTRHEMARSVEDLLARRTRCLLLDARASIEAAPTVAEQLAAELGRDPAWATAQARAFAELARGYVFADPASTCPEPPAAGPRGFQG